MKKRVLAFLLVLVLSFSCFSFTAFAATSYTSSLAFQGEHTGATRSYTGTDMHWRGSTYTQYQGPAMPTEFSVSLYRKNFIGTSLIGTVVRPREGYHNVTWSNVGSGNYYFYYKKARDGANVLSDAITTSMS
ncbi:MAG: hypothetical protein MSA01_03155 [Anaeromassilibacillus sp.]|nr:hypothetical protein [Anaeromassilibacillus sp.]MDY3779096.1 hypothetical protein [Candidatus Limousia pullorum]